MAAYLCSPRYIRSARASNAFAARPGQVRFVRDMFAGGGGVIQGTVTELGVPGSYRVRLYDRKTGVLVREQWSATNGAYAFPDLASTANGYYAVAFDNPGSPFNAAIADLITPEPMP